MGTKTIIYLCPTKSFTPKTNTMKLVMKYILVVIAIAAIPTAIVILLWLLSFGGFSFFVTVAYPGMVAINVLFIIIGMLVAAELVD